MPRDKIESIAVFIITVFPVMWLTMPEVRELFSPEVVSTITPFIGIMYYLNREWDKRKRE